MDVDENDSSSSGAATSGYAGLRGTWWHAIVKVAAQKVVQEGYVLISLDICLTILDKRVEREDREWASVEKYTLVDGCIDIWCRNGAGDDIK